MKLTKEQQAIKDKHKSDAFFNLNLNRPIIVFNEDGTTYESTLFQFSNSSNTTKQ